MLRPLTRHRWLALGLLVLIPSLVARPAAAQGEPPTGKITGRIVDAATGQGIPAAGIQVVGTTIGAQSGVDGRFTIVRVPAGTVTLQVRRIGYGPKTITGLQLAPGGTVEQDVSLRTAELQLAAVTVTATKEKGTVNDALNQQKDRKSVV